MKFPLSAPCGVRTHHLSSTLMRVCDSMQSVAQPRKHTRASVATVLIGFLCSCD